MTIEPTVFVVDDDDDHRNSLTWMLSQAGLRVEEFSSGEAYLESFDSERPGCLLLDIRMRGMDGLEVQERLADDRRAIPIIFLTGHGDVPMAVKAVKHGALDFMEKPFSHRALLDRISEAVELDRVHRARNKDHAELAERYASLTPRESEVLTYVVRGQASREIAEVLGVSARTIEKHRERLMRKMKASSTAELTLLAVECGATRLGSIDSAPR